MNFKKGQLIRMIYMQEIDPNCALGIITAVKSDVVTIHWLHEGMDHKLSSSALCEGIDCEVYEVIGVKDGKS